MLSQKHVSRCQSPLTRRIFVSFHLIFILFYILIIVSCYNLTIISFYFSSLYYFIFFHKGLSSFTTTKKNLYVRVRVILQPLWKALSTPRRIFISFYFLILSLIFFSHKGQCTSCTRIFISFYSHFIFLSFYIFIFE